MPDYKTNDPKGWCGDPTRGAAMGRATIHDEPKEWAGELTIRNIHLDEGGYDENGTYFGTGTDLWWYANEEGTIDAVLRAVSRKVAEKKIHEIYPNATFSTAIDVEAFVAQYLETALWSSTEDETPLDKDHTVDDFAPEALAEMRKDCESFCEKFGHLFRGEESNAGHDFWLTRNGHGCGFWDGDWPEDVGKALTEASKAYGQCDLYVGDDGHIYLT